MIFGELKMKTSTKGKIAEHIFIIEFLKKGQNVYIPVEEDDPVDLVVDIEGILKKMQIKYVTPRKGVLDIKNQDYSVNKGESRINWYDGKIDYFAVYNPETGFGYLVPIEIVPKTGIKLRIEKPKRKQEKINYAEDFRLF